MLFNNGIYWDDWVLYNQTKSDLVYTFTSAGNPSVGYLHYFIFSLPGVIFIVRALSFLLFFAAALFIRNILNSIKEISGLDRLFILILLLILPFNLGRVNVINFLYTICYFTFFFALWIFKEYLQKRVLAFRVISLFVFYISFLTNSLLVFYLIVPILIYYFSNVNYKSIRNILLIAARYIDFLLLPFLYFCIQKATTHPSGPYEFYNQIYLINIFHAPLETIKAFSSTFQDIITEAIFINKKALIIFLIFLFTLYYIIKKLDKNLIEGTKNKNWVIFFFLGMFFFFLSVFPYLAVGRSGDYYGQEWRSRDQLLMSVGVSFMLLYGLKLITAEFNMNRNLFNFLVASIIASFVLYDCYFYLNLQRDWYKQQSFIESLKDNPTIKNNSTFLIVDNTEIYNAMGRNVRFYEYNGILRQAFGDDTRFACEKNSYNNWFKDPVNSRNILTGYNMNHYKLTEPQYYIYIDKGAYELTLKRTIKLRILQLVYSNKVTSILKDIVHIRVDKIETESLKQF
jgi:hypothetical protein